MKYEAIPLENQCSRDNPRREGVVLLCEVRQNARPWAMARLEDISQTGFRIAWLPNCNPNAPLKIRIPGLRILVASIRWQQGKAVGCAFSEPLHVAVFEHLVSQARAS